MLVKAEALQNHELKTDREDVEDYSFWCTFKIYFELSERERIDSLQTVFQEISNIAF